MFTSICRLNCHIHPRLVARCLVTRAPILCACQSSLFFTASFTSWYVNGTRTRLMKQWSSSSLSRLSLKSWLVRSTNQEWPCPQMLRLLLHLRPTPPRLQTYTNVLRNRGRPWGNWNLKKPPRYSDASWMNESCDTTTMTRSLLFTQRKFQITGVTTRLIFCFVVVTDYQKYYPIATGRKPETPSYLLSLYLIFYAQKQNIFLFQRPKYTDFWEKMTKEKKLNTVKPTTTKINCHINY